MTMTTGGQTYAVSWMQGPCGWRWTENETDREFYFSGLQGTRIALLDDGGGSGAQPWRLSGSP